MAGDDSGSGGSDASVVDAPPAACGDGVRSPGEACYGAPLLFAGGTQAYEGQIADIDGDGDGDLMFTAATGIKYFTQQAGVFATTSQDGPAATSPLVRAVNLGGDARLELVSPIEAGITTWQTSGTSTAYTSTTAAAGAAGKAAAMAIGTVTGAAIPNVVSLFNDQIYVGTYNTSLVLANATDRSVYKGAALAVGKLDSDAYADVVAAGAMGIFVYRGKAGGLEVAAGTGITLGMDGVGIGDLDGDQMGDIVYASSGAAGTLGWMRGLGGGAVATPQTKAVTNFGSDIVVTDVDGDGLADVIGARARGTLAVLVFHGKADGTFADPIEHAIPTVTSISSIRADSDYNGDGAPDIVVTQGTTGTILVYPSTP